MSYALSAPLQAAIYDALAGDVALDGLVAGAIFDAEPTGAVPSLYVSLGPEVVKPASDVSAMGAVHEFTISVVTDAAGFAGAKTVAGAISDLLIDADLPMSRGICVGCRLLKARAAREDSGIKRRIDLTFRARVDEG